MKMSDNYEAEQKALNEKLSRVKAEIEKAKTTYDNIQRFMAIVKLLVILYGNYSV